MGRDAVDIRRNDIRLYFVKRGLVRRIAAVDRVDQPEEFFGGVTVAQGGKGPDRPERSVGVLAAIFADAGQVAFDITGVAQGLVKGGSKEQQQPIVPAHQPFQDRRHRLARPPFIRRSAEDGPGLGNGIDLALFILR